MYEATLAKISHKSKGRFRVPEQVDVDVPLSQEVKLFVENIDRRIIVSRQLIFLGLKMGTSYLTITQTATKVQCLLLFLSLTVV